MTYYNEKVETLIGALMDKCRGPEGLKKNPVTDNIILNEELFAITGVSPSYIQDQIHCQKVDPNLDNDESVLVFFFRMIVHHYQERDVGVGILENLLRLTDAVINDATGELDEDVNGVLQECQSKINLLRFDFLQGTKLPLFWLSEFSERQLNKVVLDNHDSPLKKTDNKKAKCNVRLVSEPLKSLFSVTRESVPVTHFRDGSHMLRLTSQRLQNLFLCYRSLLPHVYGDLGFYMGPNVLSKETVTPTFFLDVIHELKELLISETPKIKAVIASVCGDFDSGSEYEMAEINRAVFDVANRKTDQLHEVVLLCKQKGVVNLEDFSEHLRYHRAISLGYITPPVKTFDKYGGVVDGSIITKQGERYLGLCEAFAKFESIDGL